MVVSPLKKFIEHPLFDENIIPRYIAPTLNNASQQVCLSAIFANPRFIRGIEGPCRHVYSELSTPPTEPSTGLFQCAVKCRNALFLKRLLNSPMAAESDINWAVTQSLNPYYELGIELALQKYERERPRNHLLTHVSVALFHETVPRETRIRLFEKSFARLTNEEIKQVAPGIMEHSPLQDEDLIYLFEFHPEFEAYLRKEKTLFRTRMWISLAVFDFLVSKNVRFSKKDLEGRMRIECRNFFGEEISAANIAAQRAFVARVLTCPATQGLFELTDLPTDSRELAEIVDQHIDLFPINEEKIELSSSWFMAATRFKCFNILQAFANRPYFLYRLDSFKVANPSPFPLNQGYPSPIQEAIIVCEAEGRTELAKQLRASRGIFSRTIFYLRSVLDDLNAPAGPNIYDLAEVRANGHG